VGISSDGTHIAYNVSLAGEGGSPAANKFYLHSLSELEPKLIPAAGGTAFFSPDGQWIGFFGPGSPGTILLRKVGVGGGAPVTLCSIGPYAGGSWADDDTIYFVGAVPGGVMRVLGSGGQPEEVAKIDFANGKRMHKFPCVLPGGKALLFTVSTSETETFDDARVVGRNIETALLEGWEECFTINRPDIPRSLHRCLATSNIVDNPSGVRDRTRRVCRSRTGMAARWSAAAFLKIDKSFRKITGYRDLWALKAILDRS
jgi:hypothetical protein